MSTSISLLLDPNILQYSIFHSFIDGTDLINIDSAVINPTERELYIEQIKGADYKKIFFDDENFIVGFPSRAVSKA